MGKTLTACDICGGSYDGTPSGQSRHNRTGRHRNALPMTNVGSPEWEAAAPLRAAIEAAEAQENLTPDNPLAPRDLPALPYTRREDGTFVTATDAIATDALWNESMDEVRKVRAMITAKQETLRKREADLGWRKRHRPELADEYEASKVVPLAEEIARLTEQADAAQARAEARADELFEPERQFLAAFRSEIEKRFTEHGFQISVWEEYAEIQPVDRDGNRDGSSIDVQLPRVRYNGVLQEPRIGTYGSRITAEEAARYVQMLEIALAIVAFANAVYAQ